MVLNVSVKKRSINILLSFNFPKSSSYRSQLVNTDPLESTHHLDGHTGQVPISDGCVVTLHHVDPLPGQSLDDGQVGLQGRRLLRLQDEGADAAVELAGQQQADDGRLDVLLLVLVCVERVP